MLSLLFKDCHIFWYEWYGKYCSLPGLEACQDALTIFSLVGSSANAVLALGTFDAVFHPSGVRLQWSLIVAESCMGLYGYWNVHRITRLSLYHGYVGITTASRPTRFGGGENSDNRRLLSSAVSYMCTIPDSAPPVWSTRDFKPSPIGSHIASQRGRTQVGVCLMFSYEESRRSTARYPPA